MEHPRSQLDTRNALRPRKPPQCDSTHALHDGSVAPCEGRAGHEGPHFARLTVTWETEASESGPAP